ncbi:tyrosine-type recombinase/integrase [Chloroflexota bacterium]
MVGKGTNRLTHTIPQLQVDTNTERLTRLIEGFLLTCRVEGKSPNTVTFYKGILDRFTWYLNEYSIYEITPMAIRSFLGYIQSTEHRWGSHNSRATKKAGQVTIQRYYTGVKVFVNWCVTEGYMDTSPMTTLKKPKAPKKVVKAITPEDTNRLLNALNGKDFNSMRNKALLLLALDTGLRLSEITNLKLSDIRSEIITIMGKGSKQRIVRIGAKAQKAIWRYMILRQQVSNGCESIWITRDGSSLTVDGVHQMIVKLGKRLGIEVSPHKLRHSFALYYLRNGGDVFTLQTLLGHSTLEIVKGYLGSLSSDDAIRSHKNFSPMDNFKVR